MSEEKGSAGAASGPPRPEAQVPPPMQMSPTSEATPTSEDPRLGEPLDDDDLSGGSLPGDSSVERESPSQATRPEDRDRAQGVPVEGPPADDDTSPPPTNEPFTG
jgi:hypothetical protein